MHIRNILKVTANTVFAFIVCLSTLVMMLVGGGPLSTPVSADSPIKPIIFVHGSGGSGAQFESDAMRFTSNGYPQNLLFAFEYDTGSPTTENMTVRILRLDTFVDSVLTSTGAATVYLMGHSLGTSVCQTYLSVPARAAKVAKYVNIDGGAAAALPGGVPTLALWAGRGWSYNPNNKIVGATNIWIPNQTHVQVATSAESFVEMYKFFLGAAPATSQINPEDCNQIKLAGRVMLYPQGRGVGNATLDIWEVNGTTGARIGASPKATYTLSGSGFYDGAWGPFTARCGVQYEFVIYRFDGSRPHHFYFEPFIRSNYFVRLLTSPPGGIGDLMERDNRSAALVITRNKEFWGNDNITNTNDMLTLNGTNVINAATCPIIKVPGSTGVIGIFAYDRYLNQADNLTAPIPTFFAVGFMTGVDKYMPAVDPPNGTISVVLTPRGGGGGQQVVNILNWASLSHSVSIPFMDYFQTYSPYGSKTASVNTRLGTVNFATSDGSISNLSNLPADSMPCSSGGYIFPYGMFSYSITSLVWGATVTVTITTPTAVPMGAKVFKCQNGSLTDFTPYIQQPDPYTFILTLKDGGQGDSDGQANGTILDPCGIALALGMLGINTTPPSSSASVAVVPPIAPPVYLSNISVQSASLSVKSVTPGTPVTVTADITNKSAVNGNKKVTLYVNGQVDTTQGVTVSGGGSTKLIFNVSRSEPGDYIVYVDGVPAGSFKVELFSESDGVLVFSAAIVGLAFILGMVMLWRRQRKV